MKVLVIGDGGREHATAWKIAQSPKIDVVFCAPGNAGTALLEKGQNVDISAEDIGDLTDFAKREGIGLTVVGSENPLVGGIVNRFERKGLAIFGPNKRAAVLEGSKIFAKELAAKYAIPTALPFETFCNPQDKINWGIGRALQYVHDNWENPDKLVIKADGLALGKGVLLPATKKEAYHDVIREMLEREFKEAGERIIIEPRLYGWELSYIVLTDGKSIKPLMPGQDYKPIGDGNTGVNTGGMGGRFPLDELTPEMAKEIESKIIYPTLQAMKNKKRLFKGVLYAGLMTTEDGPKMLEYNERFGDPEQQHQMFMMLPDVDIVPYLMACVEGNLSELPDIRWKDGYCVGVVMASGGYPGDYKKEKEITFADMEDLDFDYEIFHAGTKIGEDGKIYTDGGRILLAIAHGKTSEEAKANAYILRKRIDFDGAYSRSDIGDSLLARL